MMISKSTLFPRSLLSDASRALAKLAEIDLRYQGISHGITNERFHAISGLQARLGHRQMRERMRYEHEFSVAHGRMSDLMLQDLMSIDLSVAADPPKPVNLP